jgi:hypothetical protein
MQVASPVAGGAEHQRAAGVEEAQHVDHRQLDARGRDADGAVLDVAVRLACADRGVDAQRVALEGLGQRLRCRAAWSPRTAGCGARPGSSRE